MMRDGNVQFVRVRGESAAIEAAPSITDRAVSQDVWGDDDCFEIGDSAEERANEGWPKRDAAMPLTSLFSWA